MAGKSWRDYSTDETVKKETSSEKTGSWRDYSTDQSAASGKATGGWRDYSEFDIAGAAASNVISRVNAWLNSHNSYLSEYQTRYSGRKYNYEDAYVSDSGSWLDSVSKRVNDLDAESQEILSYLDQHKDYLDADWVESVRNTITKGKDAQLQILTAAQKDNEWWSSFGSDDLVKAYGSAEDAYKYYQRADGYNKKYEGMTWEELEKLTGDMDDGEEKEWLTSYAATTKNEAKKTFDTEAGAKEIEELENFYDEVYIIDSSYAAYKANPQAYTKDEANRILTLYNTMKEKYGSVENLEKLINQKKAFLNQAKYTQEGLKLAGVADKESQYYDPEFSQYTGYVDDGNKALIPDYKDLVYDAVNNNVDSSNLAAGQSWGNGLLGVFDVGIQGPEKERLDAIKHMKDDERAIYNYYYSKHGYDAAEKYLDSIMEDLNIRMGTDRFKALENKWLLEEVFSAAAGLDQFTSGVRNFFNTEDAYIPASSTQVTSSLVREDLGDVGFKLPEWMGGASIGQGVYDLINTTANMAPSIMASSLVGALNPAAGAAVGNTLMGISSAGNAYQEALNLGYDKGQARAYSTLVGASEVGLQYLLGGIGKLGGSMSSKAATSLASKFDNVYARLAVDYGTKMASEGMEEYLQEVLTPVFKNLTLKTDEEIELLSEEALYSFVLGAISSGLMEGTGIGSESGKGLIANLKDMSSKNQANIDATNLYGGSIKELIGEGLASPVDSESRQVAEMYKRKTDKGKSMTGYEIRELIDANEAQIAVENFDSAKSYAAKQLRDRGETQNVVQIAELVAKRATGQELTRKEISTLTRSQYGAKVAKEMLDAQKAESATFTPYKSLEDRVGTESKLNVSESGKATIHASGKAIDLRKAEVTEFITDKKTGKVTDMVMKVDGEEVKASGIDYADNDQAYLVEAVGKIENITPGDAGVIIRGYDPGSGMSVGEYLNGVDEAYTYGYNNYSELDMKAGNFTPKLSSEQAMSVYKLGQTARKFSDQASDAPIVRMRTETEAKLSKKEKIAKQKNRIESDAEVYFMDGTSVVKFDEHTGEYDDKRTAAVNTAKFLSKLGIGGKYYFYESYVNEDGVRVYKDADGNEVEAPNGMYMDADGSIYIDLNAGDEGQGTALFTLGHELTHFIKAQSKSQFKVLGDLVTEAFDKTDLSMHDRVLAKQKFLEDKRGKDVSYNEAYEEVVADAMSTMLTDGSFYEKLMEIKVKDKGLFNTIKRFFDKMIAKFKKVYEELTPDQREARDIREMKDMFDRIQTAFAEALVEASDNFQAAEAQKNTTDDGGEILKSLREFEDGTRFVDVQMDEHTFDGMTVAQMNKAAKTILMDRFAGKVIGVDNRVFVNGDSVNEYLHPSKSIDLATRKAKLTAAGELDNLLDAGEALPNRPDGEDGHIHHDAIDFSYFKTIFKVGNEYFEGIVNIKNTKRGKLLKDVTKIKNITQDIVSSYGQNPKSNFLRDVSMDSIRDESGIVKNEVAEALDIDVDENTESIAPAVMKSERTWKESDYVQERDKAAKEIANAIGVTEKQAKDYIDSVNSIAKMIAEDRSRLDYFSSPGRTSFVGNVEYGGSFDFSTLCKKRRLLTGTFTAIQRALPNTALTADEILDIRNRMKEAGLEVSCGLCYVEGSRANMGQFAKEFLKLYKQYYPDAWQPNMADVNTPDGIEWVRINHPECYEQYEYFWNHYGTLKDGDKNLFASQQKPKLYQLHTEYNGEILNKFKNDDNVEDKNLNGGIRLQSFSDFEIVHLIDTMQIIMDMSRVGLAGQAYTKVPDFAWALGDTGLKINLSLIAKGVDANGKLIFDDVEGMPIADAMKLRERYSKNVGTILVAFNDEQLIAAMADDRVDFIIPFHRSQWKKSQYGAMGLPAKTKDYTFMQNEKFIKPQFHEYRGRMVKDKATNYMPNEYWDFSKSGKENAEAYLDMCARNNKRPKFYKLLQNNGDGSYSLKDDGSTDGYWKLLIDFKMYDNEGNGSPQMAVKPEFNMEEATRMLNDYSGGHSNFPVAQGIVDDFVKDYKDSHKGQKFSERGSKINSGATYAEIQEEQQKLYQRERDLAERKRTAENDPELLQALDDYSNLFAEMRGLLSKKHAGTATQEELDRIGEIKLLREEKLKRVADLQESLGINALSKEAEEIRADKEALRVASDEAWAREGAEKENKAIEKSGLSAPEYFRKKALKAFKTTTNFNESGYLLPDGKLLNFSGGERNHRYRDHREIGEIYEATNGTAALNRFLSDGNIRIMAESPGIDIASGVEPTAEQYAAIKRFIKANGVKDGQFFVDFSDAEGHGAGNYSYNGSINADRVVNDIKYYFQTGETRQPSLLAQFRNSERGEGTSNRDLLANAFEGISQNSDEYKMIQEYKGRIKILNEYEEKLNELNAEIRKLTFGEEAGRDSKKLKQLREEAKKVAENINRNDKKLLSMEASEPLRKVIDRERKKEAQKTKDHVKEIIKNKKTRAEQAELRQKIRKTIRDLDKILNRGNKKQNVKEDMKGFVSKALELADYIFTDHISNDELIRRGITVRMNPKEAALVKETEDILSKLYDNPDSLTDEEFARLDAKRKANEDKLRDLLTAQRNERLNTPVYQLFNDLVTEYTSLKNSKQDAVKAAYNEELEKSLRAFMSDDDRVKILKNMRVADMTVEELNWLYRAYTMVLTNVRDANKFHVKGMSESIDTVVTQIVTDFGGRKIPDKKLAIAAQKIVNKIGWDYEKLYYALDRIGSDAFTQLIMNIANSENTVMQDIMEAAEFRDKIVENYGFNNWDVNKKIDREFLDNTGKKFTMTLGQLMSLYAYSRREGAWDHIEYGGFVFGEKALTDPKPADSYKLSKEQCEAITGLLTKEQKGYVEDMQKFLSETMGEKGNEVSMQLYGVKMFTEKNYFPIHIAGQFKAQANESQAKAAEGFQSMSNAGFTHAQNPNAKAPFVLEGFNEVWSDHVNEMSRYHGTVPALEDLRRVMNRSSYSESTAESTSVKVVMENHFGEEAVKYFDNLYREANSGAITDKLQKNSKKLLSLFRKNSVAYSLSVLVQQPASLVRAYAMIDKKYFGYKGFGAITSGVAKAVSNKWTKAHTNAYNEMLKYAPGVTMAKEIGGFDTATGGSIRSYLLDTGKSLKQKWNTGTAMEKGKAVMDVVDNNAIANLPNVADKIAWIEIWNACKRETVATHKDLATNSDEFMQAVGERFTEVIRATQVYDSIFAKSPMLKSKNLAVQYLVSFMNEPNTVANMVESAVRDATKGNWKKGAKTAAVVAYSIIFTNVLKSIIYAMRDDDEDETYIEKYIEAITGGMMDDFIPFNYIPILRDVVSLAQGYDVERADMAIVADAVDAVNQVIKNATKDTEDMTEEELIEFDKKCTEANWKLVESVAAFFGIPIKNVRREINGVLDHARIASTNAGMTTGNSAWDKIHDAVIDTIPFMQNKSKQDKIYDAIVSGDKAYLARLKSTYKTEDAYHTAVRKALRENDSRIHAAAQAKYDGNAEEYKRIFLEIKNEGKFSFDDIMSAINSEEAKIRNGLEPDKVTSSYTAGDFVEAVAMGNASEAQAMMEDIISTKVANGKTQEEAEKEFASNVSTGIGDAYSASLLDEAGAKNMLIEYADKDEEEAASKVSYWAFCNAHPEYDLSESNVTDYREFAEPAEIELDVFVQYINGTKNLATKYDEWGDVEVTKREQVLEVIDSLPLTWQQKDALYLAAGYSESNIWDVPW